MADEVPPFPPFSPHPPGVALVQSNDVGPLGAVPPLSWSHFEPEFAGKPEEDAEAHQLRTNDWMCTLVFSGSVKVQRFCLNLVCWSFHFDENSELIDRYVTHIRQVAAVLGNGEPQALEVFKKTLSSSLYWILFSIEVLR